MVAARFTNVWMCEAKGHGDDGHVCLSNVHCGAYLGARWVFVVVQSPSVWSSSGLCSDDTVGGRASPRQLLGPSTIGDPTLRLTDGPDRNRMRFAGPKFTSCALHTDRYPVRISCPPPFPAAKKMSCSTSGRSSARSLAEAGSKPVWTLAGPWAFPRLTRSARCPRRRPIKGVMRAAMRGEAAAAG